jgi:hypothetical protein
MVNKQWGSLIVTEPLPMKVLTTPIPHLWANRRSSAAARLRSAPLPARMIGLRASAMISIGCRAPGLHGDHGRVVDITLGDVLGQLDHGDAGLLCFGGIERLTHDLRNTFGRIDRVDPLGDRAEHGMASMFW